MSDQQEEEEEEEVEEEVSSMEVCLIQEESSLCGGAGGVVVMEEGAEKEVSSSILEVCLIQESSLCGGAVVQEAEKVRMAQGCSLICVLGSTGTLLVADVAHTEEEELGTTLEGTFSDFSWEEMTVHTGSVSGLRLLAVGSQCELKLFEVEVERSGSITLVCLCQCPAASLVQMLKDKDLSVCEPFSIHMLCFVDGRCCLLLNDSSLLWLKWEPGAGDDPQPLSCCDLPLPIPACQYHLCRGTLFVLSTNGVIYVFDSVEGKQLATVNLPLYMSSGLEEEEQTSSPCPSSFCVLQVSADLSTVVAVSPSHEAVAVDLNHYFRTFPDHLLCRVTLGRPSMRPPEPRDEDSLLSSTWSHHALDTTFPSDRSWEARLSSMYNRSKAGAVPQPPISVSQPWFSDLPHPECRQALPSARLYQSRAPPCGAAVSLSIPDSASLSLLSVSEFTAVLTYVSSNPGEHQATVALWDLQSQSVSYHRADCQAVPVQRCGERQHSLLLKGSGLVQVLFGVTQEELLNRLMVFGSAATVDALCHLNSWGRCSIPLHALQAGLKNRQLDTVDFFLKSKENILNPAGSSVSDADTPSQLSTIQELRPALDLLCSSIRDSHSEAQSRQFSEQLLRLALSFLNTQVITILNNTQVLDADSERCVEILDAYITELRVYVKKFPWAPGADTARPHAPATLQQQEEERKEEQWDLLTTEALVQKAVLTNQIPRVQAFLRRQGRPDQTVSDLRCTGLRLVFNCLSNRDLLQAKTLLRNMGFNVKKQLHSVCLYTDDKDLREFVVEELATQGYLSEEEMQRVAFLREMQVLGSQPTTRCSQLTHTTSVLQLAQSEPGCRVVLEDLMGASRPQSDPADLWSSLRLDWVRHWDQNSQRTVQLSRVQDTAVASSDPAVLWAYLTSLHDRDRLVCWIESAVGQNTQPSAAPCWPELTSDLVNSNTHCSRTLREHILHLLARRGMLTKAELSDFDQLLWRMSQAGGVMMTAGTPLPPNLHKRFIQFCLDHSLQYLLYTYLQYYRLTPRNCPSLSNRTLSESQPWFDMLVKTQEISRDLTDPECVFWTSLSSAQAVLPGGQASVSSMLLEGHSLLALATIMFTPGGIDQVIRQGDRSGSPAWRVDPQLLKMTLTTYPKLRAALFPAGGPRSNPTTSDLSIYHLMQSFQPLDPSRLFVWQTANTLSPNDVSELPHFSSPDLVNRFALMERLDAAYYLRHGRPASAYVTFILQNLPGCSDVRTLLCAAAEQAYRVALQSFDVPSVAAACVCFCELLGVCSLKLRVDLRVLALILHHWTHGNTHISPATHTQNLVAKGNKLLEAEQTAAEELIGYLESAVIDSLEQNGISRTSYEAGQEWAVPVQFCQLHHLPITSVYPTHCAADGHWINFLLFVQLHTYPPQQVRLLATQFGAALQAHLSLAFQELQFNSLRRGVREDEEDEEREQNVKGEVPDPEPPRELFQVLLRSQEEPRSWTHLLGEALAQRCPLLAILAACYQEAELLQCLCVWLLSSVDDVTATEATAHLEESRRHHSWSLHDLSIIWRGLLGRGHVRPLLRGFQLFQKDCVLVHVLQMFELCSDHKNFSQAKNKLLDFQRSLVVLRSSVCVTPGGLPVQWVESQASVLLMTMLQRCATRYELHRLLLLLAGMDGLLKSNGPDFKKLSQLSEVLQAGPVCVSSRLLQPCSQQELQAEYQGLVDSLQAAGLFPQARQVAELAELPVDNLLINQLHQEFITQKAKRQWGRREARVCFWRRCHEQFESKGTSPEPAAQFFWSQAEEDDLTPRNSSTQTELLRTQERCVLLSLAGHWLSRVDPVPLPRLRLLEKCLWTNRIRERVLLHVSIETETMFSVPFPPLSAISSEEADSSSFSALSSWYEVLVNEQFCFSKISALNQESDLTLDGLPQEEPATHGDSLLSSEEWGVLSELIGQSLDEGRVHEASRVCRYFSYCHSDMRVVLHCRGLASGELTEAPPGKSLPTSPSVSSLLSFDMLPAADDQVLRQLKTLVNSCRHGSNYCKQVLGLYELSKELDCLFDDLYKEDPQAVLSQVLMSSQPERYQKAQAFIKVQNLQPNTVAQLVANATVQGILASTQDTLTVNPAERQVYRPSEGRDSFVQLAKLCGDPNLVGLSLLDLLSTVPLSKLDCIVEVLIVVHDCFSLSCNMEGIVRVLQAARHLSHAHLAPSEQYGLLVRLLTGIGRYKEMTYIFDLLHQNHRFEILLRKNVDRPPGQSSSLKAALLDYIKRCLPGDSEKHNMVALCFSMRREIGENHEMAARTQLKIIESQPWVVTPELEKSLSKVFDLLKDAAESYSKDQCVRQASRCVRMAKLVLLQRHFLKEGSHRIINLRQADLATATLALPRCYQVFVVSEAYDYSPDWAELVYQKVLVNGDFQYLEELKRHRPLTSSLFEDVSKKWTLSRPAGSSSQNLRRFLRFCDDVSTLYRLAYQHQLTDLANLLLQDCKSSSYLTDRLAN